MLLFERTQYKGATEITICDGRKFSGIYTNLSRTDKYEPKEYVFEFQSKL